MAKSSNTPEKEENTKASYWLRSSLVKKLKYIALMSSTTQTEILDQVLTKFVADWEKKNGQIPKM